MKLNINIYAKIAPTVRTDRNRHSISSYLFRKIEKIYVQNYKNNSLIFSSLLVHRSSFIVHRFFKTLTIGFLVSFSICTIGKTQNDTTILTYQTYLANILQYHPIAKQANLKLASAEAEWLLAKGNLDPKLTSDWQQKNFDDKLYYRLFQSHLKVPTQLGIDIVGGYENTEGVFLNPEDKTDKRGLWNLGLEANVLQGLLVNERMVALEQARIYQNIAKNQQQILLNELLYEASVAYLEWQKYEAIQQVFEENITRAATYFDNTKQSFNGGEKTSMDTLEAYILWQDAKVLAQTNTVFLIKAQQQLENFLWIRETPVILQPNTQPESYTEEIFSINNANRVEVLVNNHPMILEKQNKLATYEVAQRWKREKLKPKLKLKYNPLLATSDNSIAPNFSIADYKWGFDFSFPLFLRKERAGIQQGEIKIQETTFDIENKVNELINKIEGSFQQQQILQEQIALQAQNIVGYLQLLEGENQKFLYGESSVFLLNKRQEKYLNGQIKLIQLTIKLKMELLNYLYYSNGLLDNRLNSE